MHTLSKTLLAGALIATPFAAATSQDMAAAPNAPAPKAEYVVFVDRGNGLSEAAVDTVRSAVDATSSARRIELQGKPAQAQAVKAELVRHGASAEAIVVRAVAPTALPKANDGVPDPTERRVEIKF